MSKSAVNFGINTINVQVTAKVMMDKTGTPDTILLANSDGKFRVVAPAGLFPFVAPDDQVVVVFAVIKASAALVEVAEVLPFKAK